MITTAVFLRVILLVGYSVLTAVLADSHRRHIWRPYTYLILPIAAINVVFYMGSVLFRIGAFTTPGEFFTTLSNLRSLLTMIAGLTAVIMRQYNEQKRRPKL
jgi:hypothetical protein